MIGPRQEWVSKGVTKGLPVPPLYNKTTPAIMSGDFVKPPHSDWLCSPGTTVRGGAHRG